MEDKNEEHDIPLITIERYCDDVQEEDQEDNDMGDDDSNARRRLLRSPRSRAEESDEEEEVYNDDPRDYPRVVPTPAPRTSHIAVSRGSLSEVLPDPEVCHAVDPPLPPREPTAASKTSTAALISPPRPKTPTTKAPPKNTTSSLPRPTYEKRKSSSLPPSSPGAYTTRPSSPKRATEKSRSSYPRPPPSSPSAAAAHIAEGLPPLPPKKNPPTAKFTPYISTPKSSSSASSPGAARRARRVPPTTTAAARALRAIPPAPDRDSLTVFPIVSESTSLYDPLLRRRKSSNKDDYLETDDLKALVHTELPSTRRRKTLVTEKTYAETNPYYRFTKVAAATFGWLNSTRDDYDVTRPQEETTDPHDELRVSDLAETILHKDDVFAPSETSGESNTTFSDRMRRMTCTYEPNTDLHTRVVVRRASTRRDTAYAVPRSSTSSSAASADHHRLSKSARLFARPYAVASVLGLRDRPPSPLTSADLREEEDVERGGYVGPAAYDPVSPDAVEAVDKTQVMLLRETLAQGGAEVEYSEGLSKKCQDCFSSLSDVWDRFNFWSQQFKEIEGRFGIATSTYFRFTRWLVKINFLVFFLFLCFLYIPQLSYDSIFKEPYTPSASSNGSFEHDMFRCSNSYDNHMRNVTKSSDSLDIILDLAQGTGFLENTMLFYGYYSNLSFWRNGKEGREFTVNYNMGLGYLLTVGISFITVFIMIVKNSSSTIKEAVMDFDNKAFPQYTNAVFGGWDYCIKSEQMAFFKQKIIYNEFKSTLEEVRWKRWRENRTAPENVRLYAKRFGINIAVIALLGASFAAIAFSTNFMLEKQKEVLTGFEGLVINYLPSIVISVLNLIVPEIFMILCEFEDYSNNWTTRITILRAVILRLASVWVLVVALYNRLQEDQEPYNCPEQGSFNVTQCCGNTLWQTDVSIGGDSSGRGTVKCWETYVGQQFYKLSLVDFISISSIVLLIGLPRKFIYDNFKDRFTIIAKLGKSKFDLPIQVLDIVYSQTLCWIGMFFTPLLPAITFVKVFIFFFLKKFELLYVAQAPNNAYGASRSYSFFQSVLLVSFIAISSLLGFMIGNYNPSMSCGPFRLYSKEDYVMFTAITNEINSWPSVPRSIIKYFGTLGFFLPAFLILMLAIYYYSALSAGYRKMEKLLKQELKSEAHDKQFLLARVDEIIKKGQLK